MAEVEGLVASIAHTASTGARLSTALYDFATHAGRPEQEIADIADHVKNIAATLDSVASVIASHGGIQDVSSNALTEVHDLSRRCNALFAQVQHLIIKTNHSNPTQPKMQGPSDLSKEQRIELVRRRLDSLKHSIMLLLHVLRLADRQAKGSIENSALARERDMIRELHQREQDSLGALQALESKLGESFFSDDETISGSAAPSRVPTINFLVDSSARRVSRQGNTSLFDSRTVQQAPSALADDSETSDSDDTVTDDDGEFLTINELSQCATHVHKLLERVALLQQSCPSQPNRRLPRSRVLRVYRRFCRKFESEMIVHHAVASPAVQLPALVSPSHRFQLIHTQEPPREPRQLAQHTSRILPDPSRSASDRPALPLIQTQPPYNSGPARLNTEPHYVPTAPAWTISSEPLGPGSRPKLPPLISTLPSASQASPVNEALSPIEDQDAKHSGTDGDGEHGSQNGPVVYTKTGRISKAKKGLKVHVCEECGRSFTRAEHLRRHQKNHGPNQVRCELCGKVFFRADLLQRHLERHKDLPQGYRFSSAPIAAAEGASPPAGDEAHHRHILPAPGHAATGLPHQSPGGRSIGSSGNSTAPTPLEIPATHSAVTQRARSAWDPPSAQSMASHTPVDNPPLRQQAWQAVNVQERPPESSEAAYSHASSPYVQQNPHPGLPKLQPKVAQPKVAPDNGASGHKRYSNILPAPGVSDALQAQGTQPQSHMPTMLSASYGTSPTQAAGKIPSTTIVHYDSSQVVQSQGGPGPHGPSSKQEGRIIPRSPTVSYGASGTSIPHANQGHRPIGIQSPMLPSFRNSPVSPGTFRQGPPEQPNRVHHDGPHPSVENDSGKFSSDHEGVNWRLAGSEPQSCRKRKHNRTVSHNDASSSGVDEMRGGPVSQRTPEATHRSHSGSRSLSLVTPQDERDHALLGRLRQEDRPTAGLVSHPRGPSIKTLSPAHVDRRSTSRPSTGVSDAHMGGSSKEAGAPLSPEPESPYSLATINRYIKNQGPQPGANQEGEMTDQDAHAQKSVQTSTTQCERCSEYSIKCDGRLPQCTACATTKYAGECSFASMSSHQIATVGSLGPHRYENMTAMTRQALEEPPRPAVRPDQGYNSDGDLPSPYLRPRDRIQQAEMMSQIPSAPLHSGREAQSGGKRKAKGEGQFDGETDDRTHGRKKSKSNHMEDTNGKGKDIVDVLLDQWSVPAH